LSKGQRTMLGVKAWHAEAGSSSVALTLRVLDAGR